MNSLPLLGLLCALAAAGLVSAGGMLDYDDLIIWPLSPNSMIAHKSWAESRAQKRLHEAVKKLSEHSRNAAVIVQALRSRRDEWAKFTEPQMEQPLEALARLELAQPMANLDECVEQTGRLNSAIKVLGVSLASLASGKDDNLDQIVVINSMAHKLKSECTHLFEQLMEDKRAMRLSWPMLELADLLNETILFRQYLNVCEGKLKDRKSVV